MNTVCRTRPLRAFLKRAKYHPFKTNYPPRVGGSIKRENNTNNMAKKQTQKVETFINLIYIQAEDT